MKDYLETLEVGDNKIKLSKEEIKSILAEHGKSVSTETKKVQEDKDSEISTYKATIDDLKQQIEKAPKSDELESLKTRITEFETKEAERVKLEEEKIKDETFMNNINEVIGDKKFVNEFTKNAIINELKTALKDETNVNKTTKDIFEAMTKDKTDIFVNPNTVVDMPSVGDSNDTNVAKDIPLIW